MFKSVCLAGSLVALVAMAATPSPQDGQPPKTGPGAKKALVPVKQVSPPPPEPSSYVNLTNLNVHKCLPRDTSLLRPLGVLETDGFKTMAINLLGISKSPIPTPGEIGVILVPDCKLALHAKNRYRRYVSCHTIKAPHRDGEMTIFGSGQVEVTIGFPRYKVWAFNTTDRTAEVSLHVYMTR